MATLGSPYFTTICLAGKRTSSNPRQIRSDSMKNTTSGFGNKKREPVWQCVENCGACCKLDKGPSFPSPEEIFDDPSDIELFNSLVGPDGWCVHFDKATRKCSIYADRPYFCRTEPYVFEKLYGIEKKKFNKEACGYIKGTLSAGLIFKQSSLHLQAYSDSDWASDIKDRKSTTGFCIFLGANLVSWLSKKQTYVARSSTEAEYRALATTAAEILWLTYLMRDLHIPVQLPALWCDNQSAVALAFNAVFHNRTKHIDVDFHFIRDQLASKKLTLAHIPASNQLADILTKPLSAPKFNDMRAKLPLQFPSSSA